MLVLLFMYECNYCFLLVCYRTLKAKPVYTQHLVYLASFPWLILLAQESINREQNFKLCYHPSNTRTSGQEIIFQPFRLSKILPSDKHKPTSGLQIFCFFLSKISFLLMRYGFLSETFLRQEAISNIDLPCASVLDTACFNFARTQPIPGITLRYTQLFPLSDRSHFHLLRPVQRSQV